MPAADCIRVGWVCFPLPIDQDHRYAWWSIPQDGCSGEGMRVGWFTLDCEHFGPAPPRITGPTSVRVTVNTPFNFQITARGSPTSFDASPLPAGLSVNTTTGLISGTPTAEGTTTVVISATNAEGTTTRNLSLTVAPVTVVPPAAGAAYFGPGNSWILAPPPVPAIFTPAFIKGLANTNANPQSGSVLSVTVPAGGFTPIFAYPLSKPAPSQIMQQGLGMNIFPGFQFVTVNVDGTDYRVYWLEAEFAHGTSESYHLTIG